MKHMRVYMFRPADPNLRSMLSLCLHESIVRGLRSAGALGDATQLTAGDAEQLLTWADSCDNPHGQRAAAARLVANTVLVGGGAEVAVSAAGEPTGFWEAAAR
jgi:hypothetical protein